MCDMFIPLILTNRRVLLCFSSTLVVEKAIAVQLMVHRFSQTLFELESSLERDSTNMSQEARIYNKKKADPFCRLRVPRYLKAFEAVFLISFVVVYLAVLVPVQRTSHHRPRRPGVPPLLTTNDPGMPEGSPTHNFHHVTTSEILLYIWIIAFAYDECESVCCCSWSSLTFLCSRGIHGRW
jgi:hypothetical protein